jgi:uncharacterized delta-60 repeat protein
MMPTFPRILRAPFAGLALLFVDGRDGFAQSGSLDPTFGSGGIVTTNLSPNGIASDVLIEQGTNKILAVGRDVVSNNMQWSILRFHPDGSIDTGYGNGGKVVLFGPASSHSAQDGVLDSFNRLLVTGWAKNGTHFDFTVVRLNAADGSLDSLFGGDGIVQTPIGTGKAQDFSYAVTTDPTNGKIVVAGSSPKGKSTQVAVVRYLPDGTLDTTFDGDGVRTDDISPQNDEVRRGGVIVQTDGKVILAGSKGTFGQTGFNEWLIARYNVDGSNDGSFGSNGKVLGAFGGLIHQRVWGLALQGDGKLIASGRAKPSAGGEYHTLVARYLLEGAPDPSFDGDGWNVTTALVENQGFRCALQADGKVVVAGNYETGGANLYDLVVTRFATDGTLDAAFDGDGRSELAGIPGNDEFGEGIAIDLDGKIVAGGFSAGPSGQLVILARWIP